MDKYTVLLVDDEEEVIQVIMKKIDWEGLGFSVIGYANNDIQRHWKWWKKHSQTWL